MRKAGSLVKLVVIEREAGGGVLSGAWVCVCVGWLGTGRSI